MSADPILRFLEQLSTDEDLFRDVAAVAAKHGIDITSGELTEDELDTAAGGTTLLQKQQDTMEAMVDGSIDAAKSSYGSSRESFKLAMRILRDHQERLTQVTQKISS